MDSDASFEQFMEHLRAGSSSAAERLVSELTPHVLRVIRRRLDRKLRRKFDSTDFAQMVWASFFRDDERRKRIPDRAALERFLAALAHNKTVDEFRRRFRAERYRITRERAMTDVSDDVKNIRASDPSPSQVAIGKETWHMIQAKAGPNVSRLLRRLASGETVQEVAGAFNLDPSTARRFLRRLRRKLERECHG